MFEPIAIVGRACVLPGALSPEALWRQVVERHDLIRSAPAGHWGMEATRILGAPGRSGDNRAFTDRGGYVSGFHSQFDAAAFGSRAEEIKKLDPLFHWLLHCCRRAMHDAGIEDRPPPSTGLIVGNLSYPTRGLAEFAQSVWLGEADAAIAPANRFTSGYPVHLAAEVLGIGGDAFALDAACASSLYALKLACDQLHDRSCDVMLAGGINRADDLFLHVGFSVLQAISPTGRSRPFHREADGLLPAEGAGIVVLKRLDDAIRDESRIHGVIRGIGLSNDGREGGFLAPGSDGQVRAMQSAYEISGVDPADIAYVECHATGTPVGDAVEVASMARVFAGAPDLRAGSLKSNFGHLITASGIAALIKVLGALEAKLLPPTLHAEDPIEAFAGTSISPQHAAEAWPDSRPKLAAINNFGFGGNNAHLIVERWEPAPYAARQAYAPARRPPVAVCGLGVAAGGCESPRGFASRLGNAQNPQRIDEIRLPGSALRFPPSDLKESLPQQTLMLCVASRALAGTGEVPSERVGVIVGMGCDPQIARYGALWRMKGRDGEVGVAQLVPPLTPAAVVGTMPNIAANRLNAQYDWRGFGFTVSGEELSGTIALRLAAGALQRGEVDAVLVGAVDLSCETAHAAAAASLLPEDRRTPGDAAVALVLKRLADAERDRDVVWAMLDCDRDGRHDGAPAAGTATATFGHAHAASGLLHVTEAILAVAARARSAKAGLQPVIAPPGRSENVVVQSFSGRSDRIRVTAPERPVTGLLPVPRPLTLHFHAGDNRTALAEAIEAGRVGSGPVRLSIVTEGEESVESKARDAVRLLREGHDPAGAGVYFRSEPVEGEVAFCFTGAAASYDGMGRDLLLAFPEIADELAALYPFLAGAADQVFSAPDLADPFEQLKAGAVLSQAHAVLTRRMLGIRADAAIGLSSGETNALYAFGVWRDMAEMFAEITASGMYGRFLTGECHTAHQAYGVATDEAFTWRNWRVLAPVTDVQLAVAAEPRVSVTIVNGASDCTIGGEESACSRVLKALGRPVAVPLGQDMVVHSAAMEPFKEVWEAIHTRRTYACGHVRFYSNAGNRAFRPTRKSVAHALTRQALSTIDFTKTVERAWQDGVRIFIEHGPRDTLTRSVRETLHGRPHLAVALDRRDRGDLVQLAHVAGQLFAAGVPFDHAYVAGRLGQCSAPLEMPRGGKDIVLPGHWPEIRLARNGAVDPEPLSRDTEIGQTMLPAPKLPPVADLVPVAGLMPGPRQLVSDDTPVAAVLARTSDMHREYLDQQARLNHDFIRMQGEALRRFLHTRTDPPLPARRPEPAPEIAPGRSRALSREELEAVASGRISDVLGPEFRQQDGYRRQVRMPEPPLLLVDRVTGLAGEPGTMKLGSIQTETDVREDAWYLHHGRMTPGMVIESGQADLLLISWLGVDVLNRGDRVYRLLGCDLTFHGAGLPRPGDTLAFDIHIEGHAKSGDVRLFFFRYDCHVDGRLLLSVRNGQAGFFTDAELDASAGVLWTAQGDMPKPCARLDAPPQPSTKQSFSAEDVGAFIDGDAWRCFGPGFELAATHQRTPSTPKGRMRLIDSVSAFDPDGGPWGRGYLRAVAEVPREQWFYRGHFKNDPCMPGTLMAEAAVQALSFHMAALGFTIGRDGWRFEPVSEETCRFICRGQVVPDRPHRLTYEVFVEEVIDGPEPTIFAALLCSCDGLKVFHCRRFGVRLVPDWPLSTRALAAQGEALRIVSPPGGIGGDVRGDYAALLACAWGAPEDAFGSLYRGVGQRRVPRLPGPPYHFISRILNVDAPPGRPKEGAVATVEYDVPQDAWYFDDSGCDAMPFCAIVEVLLQPCGWLASYMGFALSEGELFFRNLDGESAAMQETVSRDTGVLRTRATLSRFSRAGATTIVFFRVECEADGRPIMSFDTSFGFFSEDMLRSQVGLPVSAEQLARLNAPSDFALDLSSEPDSLFDTMPRLGRGRLRMLDAITGYWRDGGAAGLGRIRARQSVEPDAWYFKAHFFQDPVQPGSLGLEALLQLLQAFVRQSGVADHIRFPRFEAPALDRAMRWKYRGQVRPTDGEVITEIELTGLEVEEGRVTAIASGSLWVDRLRIYEVDGLAVRVVEGDATHDRPTWIYSAGRQPWLLDHRPTLTVPALPAVAVVDMVLDAARTVWPDAANLEIADLEVFRWLTVPEGSTLCIRGDIASRGEAEATVDLVCQRPNAPDVEDRMAAATVLRHSAPPARPPVRPPLLDAPLIEDPYLARTLFHGPSFRIMTACRRDARGASAVLQLHPEVPRGRRIGIGLLDAALHGVPHDSPEIWYGEAVSGSVAFPVRIRSLRFFGEEPLAGEVRVEARPLPLVSATAIGLDLQISSHGQVWAEARIEEALLPKGRLGGADALDRHAFIAERRHVPGLSLSHQDGPATALSKTDVTRSNWLPGTLETLYGIDGGLDALTRGIAAREHVARLSRVHPATIAAEGGTLISPGMPLTAFALDVAAERDRVRVTEQSPPALDIARLRDHWRGWIGGDTPVEQVFLSLISRFLRHVVVEDAGALGAVRGRPVIFLGNHQVGIESLLFAVACAAVQNLPVLVVAKEEHRHTWLGRLITHCQEYPGARIPRPMLYVDRGNPDDMLTQMRDVGRLLAAEGLSMLVHADGTRALSCRQPVQQVSSVLIDLAVDAGLPIVPIRFSGGLPIDPSAERLEFPLGFARQDIHLGPPVLPEALAERPSGKRRDMIRDAINRTGPDLGSEEPQPGDPRFAEAVARLAAELALEVPRAVVLQALLDFGPAGELSKAVVSRLRGCPAAAPDDSAEARWLERLAAWFRERGQPGIAQ